MLGKESRKETDPEDPETIEDVNEQLEQVERKVKQRLAEEEQGKLEGDPVQQVMKKIGAEQKLIAKMPISGPLR